MAGFQVRFYQRTDQGRLRLLKTVVLPGDRGTMRGAVGWAAGVLERTTPDVLSRVVEVRVVMVETQAPRPASPPQKSAA